MRCTCMFLHPPWKKTEVDDHTRQDYTICFTSPFVQQVDGKEEEMHDIRELIQE